MKKKILSIVLIFTLLFSSIVPSFADTINVQGYDVEVDGDKDSIEYVEYGTFSEEGTHKTDVYAVVSSKFQVTIPKVIVLKGNKGATSNATYQIDVDGDISGDEYILVKPDNQVVLQTTNKPNTTATITQTIQKFRTPKYQVSATDERIFVDETSFIPDTTGIVEASLSAGAWKGVFNFKIELVSEVTP